ncbi:ribosome maturation factor RimM [Paludibacter jiangxiensis]|uniref:Ribosome maturation factor RimM n=1 Tax=Paludibacter jiangxiensis TaxID=681398 RepID=A0A161LHZ1_9BACT|nr:ribosome maturation factor RimM [Paludibacter jiangxiensis]GAT61886.1 16S rRNA processing protein RimM [Paludibacter jiangxiensis]
MILQSDLYPIGHVQKTHGIKGELSIFLTSDFDSLDFEYLVFEMDGILVPFFIQEWRFKTAETALIKFERVEDEIAGKDFVGKTIYVPKESMPASDDDVIDIQFYTGYRIEDAVLGEIGEIKGVDDTTENVLFQVMHKGNIILIPAVDEWIVEIDDTSKVMKVQMPEGLLNINEEE